MRRAELAGVALVAAACLQSCLCARFYATPWPAPVEAHRVVTDDGWSIDLRHVAPSAPRVSPRPVVLLHGVVTNGRNCDLDERHSLARFLASRGFDVWVPSLRGTGESEHRSLLGPADDLDFDTYLEHDLPAILAYVQRAAGASEVDWVGHSMGGMLLYAHLAKGQGGIGRGVILGSPVRFGFGGLFESLARKAGAYAGAASWVPLSAVARSTLPIEGSFDGPVERLLLNLQNTTPDTWRRFLAVGVDDVPAGLARQFAGWVEHDRFTSRDGAIDYLAGLAAVRVPMFVVAGKVDGIAPPWVVRPGFEALGSPEKRWMVLSEANGMRADYNHMDMLLGERAPDELWGRIADFLQPAKAAP